MNTVRMRCVVVALTSMSYLVLPIYGQALEINTANNTHFAPPPPELMINYTKVCDCEGVSDHYELYAEFNNGAHIRAIVDPPNIPCDASTTVELQTDGLFQGDFTCFNTFRLRGEVPVGGGNCADKGEEDHEIVYSNTI
jgi:hypothetical protein